MSRDYRLYLADMRACCNKIIQYTRDQELDDFLQDSRTYDATVRNLEVIGEAAKSIPADVQQRYPEVEWRRISGLRNILVHAYFGIDEDILWDIIQNRVPDLLSQLDRILAVEGAGGSSASSPPQTHPTG